MTREKDRRAGVLGFTAAALAVLFQVGLAELFGFTHLGELAVTDDRMAGVDYSLLRWFTAAAVVAGITLARTYGAGRWPAVVSGLVGGVLAVPLAAGLGGTDRLGFALAAAGGAGLGALAGAASRTTGVALVTYSASVWFLGILALGVAQPMRLYPGLVETLGLDRLDAAQQDAYRWTGLPYQITHYHLPAIAPCAALLLVLVVLAARGGSLLAAVSGPLLAAAAYWIPPLHLQLWNRDAAVIALIIAALSVLAATVTKLVPRADADPAINAPESG